MQSKPKSNSIVTSAYADGVLAFNVQGHETLTLTLAQIHPANRERAEIHGWCQRIVDAAAIERTDKDGRIIPAPERDRMKYEAMRDVIEHYASGADTWSRKRKAGEPKESGLTWQAIMDVFETDREGAKTMVEGIAAKRDIEPRAALAVFASTKEVAKRIAELRADRAAKSGVDANSLLDELNG